MIRKLALSALPLLLSATPAAAWCGSGSGAYSQNCEGGVKVLRARTAMPDPAVALAYADLELQRDQLATERDFRRGQLRLQAEEQRDARFNTSRELALAEREQSLFYTRGLNQGFGGLGYNTFGGFAGGFAGGFNDPFLPPVAFRGFVDTNQRPFPRTDVNRIARPGVIRNAAPATRIRGTQGRAPH